MLREIRKRYEFQNFVTKNLSWDGLRYNSCYALNSVLVNLIFIHSIFSVPSKLIMTPQYQIPCTAPSKMPTNNKLQKSGVQHQKKNKIRMWDIHPPHSPKMSLLYSCSSVVANVKGEPRATDHPKATSVALPSISCKCSKQ